MRGRIGGMVDDRIFVVMLAIAVLVLVRAERGRKQFWRFSLRDLLIVATLAAVALGMAVYTAKQ